MTSAGTTGQFAVEWGGRPSEDQKNDLGWPELHAAKRCDGQNPMTGRVCVNGHHQGYHRDDTGAEWLDDE